MGTLHLWSHKDVFYGFLRQMWTTSLLPCVSMLDLIGNDGHFAKSRMVFWEYFELRCSQATTTAVGPYGAVAAENVSGAAWWWGWGVTHWLWILRWGQLPNAFVRYHPPLFSSLHSCPPPLSSSIKRPFVRLCLPRWAGRPRQRRDRRTLLRHLQPVIFNFTVGNISPHFHSLLRFLTYPFFSSFVLVWHQGWWIFGIPFLSFFQNSSYCLPLFFLFSFSPLRRSSFFAFQSTL